MILFLHTFKNFTMTLAIFDLDHTLLNGDSDYLWGVFLVEHNIVDADYYRVKNEQFFEDYKNGLLDIEAYLDFSLQPLAQHPLEKLYAWRKEFITTKIEPIIATKTHALIQSHKDQGHTLVIVSATNHFVTEPIAQLLQIPNLLATKPEMINDAYTGSFTGIPTFQAGKIKALEQWMKVNNTNLKGSYFYSDSINDLPLLEKVDHPITVNPDDKLKSIANKNNWPKIDLNS